MSDPIYLDYNASTPIAPEALEAMLPFLRDQFGNPSSTHAYGVRARAAVEEARRQVAGLLGAHPDEILFTSGGSESDNLAILGVAAVAPAGKRHIITSVVEHPAVTAPLRRLEENSWHITRVDVDETGRVRAEEVIAAMSDETALITIMHANNETGALQPVAAVAAEASRRGILMHTDAAQSAGKIPTRAGELGVDLMALAGHKLYAPTGVGALFVRRGTRLAPQLLGADHEAGMRAGTENVPSLVALGTACALAARELPERTEHLRKLRDRLHRALQGRIPDLQLNGPEQERLPNTLNVSIPGVDANALLAEVDGVATAAGAACHAGGNEPSRVLLAMGLSTERALQSLRLTVGRPTTEAEVDSAAQQLTTAALRLRGGAASTAPRPAP